MEEMTQGTRYQVAVQHVFEGIFTHFEDKDGVKIAVFQQPGSGRYGEYYRRIPVSNIKNAISVIPDE